MSFFNDFGQEDLQERFPLCSEHHREAHSRANWIFEDQEPVLGNRNTSEFYKLLRQGWLEKQNSK